MSQYNNPHNNREPYQKAQNSLPHPISQALGLLEAMNAPRQQDFKVQVPMYEFLLEQWPDALTKRVVNHAVLTRKWRPSPAELREIAAELESPVPSVDAALEEVMYLIRRYGSHAAPHPSFPDNPNIRAVGEPTFSHPLIAATVRRLGGWVALCEGEAQYQEGGLQGGFRNIYGRSVSEWQTKVSQCLDSGERPAALFPAYVPFDRAQLESVSRELMSKPVRALPAAPPAPEVPMPPALRIRIEALGEAKDIQTATHGAALDGMRQQFATPATDTEKAAAMVEREYTGGSTI